MPIEPAPLPLWQHYLCAGTGWTCRGNWASLSGSAAGPVFTRLSAHAEGARWGLDRIGGQRRKGLGWDAPLGTFEWTRVLDVRRRHAPGWTGGGDGCAMAFEIGRQRWPL